MDERSKCILRIERLVIVFLRELQNERLLPLQIPCLSSAGNLEEIMETDDTLWSMGERQLCRSIESPLTSRGYAQLWAIIAMVAELQSCNIFSKNSLV